MQVEVDAQATARPIRILGVNEIGLESGNPGITGGRVLPWLQPTAGQDVWGSWQVQYRDVYIVGPGNEHLGTFNLTVHDLADPANYAALRDQLLEAANE
jgi:hypothetical protein